MNGRGKGPLSEFPRKDAGLRVSRRTAILRNSVALASILHGSKVSAETCFGLTARK